MDDEEAELQELLMKIRNRPANRYEQGVLGSDLAVVIRAVCNTCGLAGRFESTHEEADEWLNRHTCSKRNTQGL